MTPAPLKLDWCSHDAAKHAVKKWHYSRCMPRGKVVKVGVWERGHFVGCVMFGRGATPNLCKPYGLTQLECCELVRVALNKHETPVTRIISIAARIVRKSIPGLRLVVSFADPSEGHHGGIYQGGNWIYAGQSNPAKYFRINGRVTHPRSVGAAGGVQSIAWIRANIDPCAIEVHKPGKHRYLMPFDNDMRAQIAPLAKPYPKRAGSVDSGTPGVQPGRGGANPTSALLQNNGVRHAATT